MNVKEVVAVLLVCGGLASLGGCASMGKGSSRDLAASLSNDPANPVDTVYVARINHQAANHYAIVMWVNPPHKADKIDVANAH